ncbi:hypothetical protein ACEWX6_07610 [Helicobacter pylori]|uniref:hypothetical protein n=1 Tax=Helicobacter pylori TaxID=210 RepID=UPI0035A967D1
MAFYHSIILSFYHSIILSFYHSIILSFYHSIILSFYHSIILSFKQRYHNFYHFYKNLFKNPLLFIILSFINSHNLFKKFDSISPIFQSVGLTELNSKEK